MTYSKNILRSLLYGAILVIILFQPVLALSNNDRKYLYTPFYDPDSANQASCGTILDGADNESKVWNYLIGKNMTAIQAAGAMGNLHHEGNFNPRIVEGGGLRGGKWVYSKPFDRSSNWSSEMNNMPQPLTTSPPNGPAGQPGYGIVQWTSLGRKQGLLALAKEKNIIESDLGLQLEYMWQELSGPYDHALDRLLAATELDEAVSAWQDDYEVGQNFQPRFTAAQEYLIKYGSGAPSGNTSGSSTSCGSSGGPIQLDEAGCPKEPVPESETIIVQGIRVHPCIAAELDRVLNLAKERGINLSGWGWRSYERQIELRKKNCGSSNYAIYEKPAGQCSPPTAIPGRSNHERGSAVDFTCDGRTFSSQSHACFIFLNEEANTSLKNLPSEAWHWSINGN